MSFEEVIKSEEADGGLIETALFCKVGGGIRLITVYIYGCYTLGFKRGGEKKPEW